ncbi:MAG: hypothetical protein ABI678_20620 [Kofleriaceae bacterium]
MTEMFEGDDGRSGLVLGAATEGGDLVCSTPSGADCGDRSAKPAAGLSVHAGQMIGPELALLGELWGMAHTEQTVTASQILATANVRGWVAPRLWLQGGLGVARSTISYKTGDLMATEQSDTVPAFAAAAGVEVLHERRFALDIEARGGSASASARPGSS